MSGNTLFAQTVPTDSVAIDRLLMRISKTSETVSYSGIQIRNVRHRSKSIEYRWQEYHWHPDRTVVIFQSPKDLRHSKIVFEGEQAREHWNKHASRRFRYRSSEDLLKNGQLFEEIVLLRQNYRVTATAGPLFLNRKTISIRVEPRYPVRPALEALVDSESGLLLQTRRFPEGFANADLAEGSEFLEISFGRPDTSEFTRAWSETKPVKKRRSTQKYPDLASLKRSYEADVLVPKKLPDGFALLQIKSIQRRGKMFLHFLYGDGLAFVSLFQNKAAAESSNRKDEESEKRQRSRRERDRVKSHKQSHDHQIERRGSFYIIRGKKANISFSIVGEISQTELTGMADSLDASQ